jgi:hypothetical protein
MGDGSQTPGSGWEDLKALRKAGADGKVPSVGKGTPNSLVFEPRNVEPLA